MLLMLLFLGGGESTATPVDTHDGAGWAIHQRAADSHRKRALIKRPDQATEIAGEMRAALAPKVAPPAPMVAPTYEDDEEEMLCLCMI